MNWKVIDEHIEENKMYLLYHKLWDKPMLGFWNVNVGWWRAYHDPRRWIGVGIWPSHYKEIDYTPPE